MQCVENCLDPDLRKHVLYEQPVWQTLQMFRTSLLTLINSHHLSTRSRRNVLSVNAHICQRPIFYSFQQGFLPIIYTWFKTRHQSSALLLTDPDDDSHIHNNKLLASSPKNLTGWNILLFWIPAACDLTGTTVRHQVKLSQVTFPHLFLQLMNVGLLYTPVSIYQMTCGALVLFVGILSVLFLQRCLWLYQFSHDAPRS